MPVLGACFMCNVVAGNLLNTGAFEIKFNGEQVWSKIETGRFPQMDELVQAMTAAMNARGGHLCTIVHTRPHWQGSPHLAATFSDAS